MGKLSPEQYLALKKSNPDLGESDSYQVGLKIPAKPRSKAKHKTPAKLPTYTEGATMTATLPLPPSANQYWRPVGNRMIVTEVARDYKRSAAMSAWEQGMKPVTGPVRLTLRVFRAWGSGDTSNFVKILEDGLNGIAYLDDKQTVQLRVDRFDDPSNPRAEVEVTELIQE